MSETYQVSKKIINRIFKDLIDTTAINETENIDAILDLFLNELDQHVMECIIHLMMSDTKYEVLSVGDYVKLKPPNYHIGTEYEKDVLIEMGLVPNVSMVYGIVKSDSSWSTSTPFNPFYRSIKINLMYHDSDGGIKYKEDEFNPLMLTKVNKESIKYFNSSNETPSKEEVELLITPQENV
jgi:hypothetical protein|tara:strand:- start:7137 stop:7679 length:543 start_codon:yes stop_codon:yes gene_type:complete